MSFCCTYNTITVWSLLSDLAQPSWMDKWTETYIPTRWRMCQVLFPSTSWVASYHFKHIVQWYMYWCLFVNGITVHCFGKIFVFYMFLFWFFVQNWISVTLSSGNGSKIAMQPGWWKICDFLLTSGIFRATPRMIVEPQCKTTQWVALYLLTLGFCLLQTLSFWSDLNTKKSCSLSQIHVVASFYHGHLGILGSLSPLEHYLP